MLNGRIAIRRFFRALCSLVAAGFVALPIVSCSGKDAHAAGFALEVTPAAASIASGTDVQLTAMALYGNGVKQDVTTSVAWSSSDPSVASVDSGGGLAAARVPGSATIEARLSGVLGTMALTVTNAELATIEITPAVPSIAKSATLQFTATGVFTDHSTQDLTQQVVWASSDEFVAKFEGDAGLATGVDVGNATISATFSGVSGSAVLAITPATLSAIEITPSAPLLPKGTAVQLTAMGIYSDGTLQDLTTQVAWQSSDPSVAEVAQGRVDAMNIGQVTISAMHFGVTGAMSVEVSEAALASIAVEPAMPTLAKGTELRFSATGTFSDGTTLDVTAQAIWESSDAAVCALSNAPGSEGNALALEVGSATVSVRLDGKSASTQITVSAAALVAIEVAPALPSIAKGTEIQFSATGIYTDGSHQDLSAQATWNSTDAAVATVSNADGSQGLGSGLAKGTSTISAGFAGTSGTTDLTVSAATLVSIEVTPASPTIAKGTEIQFTATGIYTDGSTQDLSTQAGWSCSPAGIATISSSSVAQGLSVGSATVTATFDGHAGSTSLAVSAATLQSIELAPQDASIALGTALQFEATGIYSDATRIDITDQVTWTSSDHAIATVGNAPAAAGHATAVGQGTATIRAALGSVSSSTTLAVLDAALVSVSVSPADVALPLGTTQVFTASAAFSDGSIQDVTGLVTWASSDDSVATIANAPASPGVARAHALGNTSIVATLQGISGGANLAVTGATLLSITVTPAAATIVQGYALQLVATGSYTDGSTLDLTAQATWSSSHALVATVSNGAADRGLASGVAAGSATISATLQGQSGSALLTVDPKVLVGIDISPIAPSVPKSFQVQFSATGRFNDGSTQDFTALVAWSSSDTGRATISNATGSNGLATSDNPGTCTISFAYQSFSGSTSLSVTHAKPVSTVISPASVTLAVGQTQQLTAIATFDDGTIMDVTQQREWTCSHPNRVAVNASGLATGLMAGQSTVIVHVGGANASVQVTVQ